MLSSTAMPTTPAAVHAILLGRAQDAGVPQAGCACARCAAACADPARRFRPACLGLVEGATGQAWLIDATPDFPSQLRDLLSVDRGYDVEGHADDDIDVDAHGHAAAPRRLAGILLTHAHIGHYAGLIHLGREAMGVRSVPVYASASMAAFLTVNAPWRQLVELGNIELRVFDAGEPLTLSDRLSVTPVAVPHRAEWSDAHAFVVRGPTRRLLWCPDIDRWDDLDGGLRRLLIDHRVDLACLDATFLDAGELGGRDMRDVPHPLAGDTVAAVGAARAAGWGGEAWLVHFNHTNGLLDDAGAAAGWGRERGGGIGVEGGRWGI